MRGVVIDRLRAAQAVKRGGGLRVTTLDTDHADAVSDPEGAGVVAARKYGAAEIVDPRPAAVGSIRATFDKYRHLDKVLPAMGYGETQVEELGRTIDAVDCDLVVSATPIDLRRLIRPNKKLIHVSYELEEIGSPNLAEVLSRF